MSCSRTEAPFVLYSGTRDNLLIKADIKDAQERRDSEFVPDSRCPKVSFDPRSKTEVKQHDSTPPKQSPIEVHGLTVCPCKPVGAWRHPQIRTDRFLETLDPKQHRATINTVDKHVFPPRERRSWTTLTQASYPPRHAPLRTPAPLPPLGQLMHEDKKLREFVSETRREFGPKERNTAPFKYTDQAYHTFQFQEDQRNADFESTHQASYPPRFGPPARPERNLALSHATPGDQKNMEYLSEAQRAYVEHPPAKEKPIINDQSRHTYNFQPEARLSDTRRTNYDVSYPPRLAQPPERVNNDYFFQTHFKMGDLTRERNHLSLYNKEFVEYERQNTGGCCCC